MATFTGPRFIHSLPEISNIFTGLAYFTTHVLRTGVFCIDRFHNRGIRL